MPTTYPHLGLEVPDQGTTPWYAALLSWLSAIDTFAGGHWAPLSVGDPASPDSVYLDGEVVMIWVEN